MSYYPTHPQFTSPTRRRLPYHPYSPPQWKAAMGRPALYFPLTFDYPGTAQQGVSLRELRLKGTATPMRGAGETVLKHTRVQHIVFRILWPGYSHVEWCRSITIVSREGEHITRVALAVQIATNFISFCEKTQYETPTATDWMISPACVRFEHLFLVSLNNTVDNVWQADVALDLC